MTYEAIVPWWDTVARGELPDDVAEVSPAEREFADILHAMRKVVLSRTLPGTEDRTVLADGVADRLTELKRQQGRSLFLSCGPATLGPLAAVPGLIDEYLLVVHPIVLTAGPRLVESVEVELALRLTDAIHLEGGTCVLRYAVSPDGAFTAAASDPSPEP